MTEFWIIVVIIGLVVLIVWANSSDKSSSTTQTSTNRNPEHSSKMSLLKDLVTLSQLDGKISSKEADFINKYIKNENLDAPNVHEIANAVSAIPTAYPTADQEKKKYLTLLVLLMMCDGKCSSEEIVFCENTAIKLGFNKNSVKDVIANSIQMIDDEDVQAAGFSYILSQK